MIRATLPSTLVLDFDPDLYRPLRQSQKEHIAYLLDRLLSGEDVAEEEFSHLGLVVELVEQGEC